MEQFEAIYHCPIAGWASSRFPADTIVGIGDHGYYAREFKVVGTKRRVPGLVLKRQGRVDVGLADVVGSVDPLVVETQDSLDVARVVFGDLEQFVGDALRNFRRRSMDGLHAEASTLRPAIDSYREWLQLQHGADSVVDLPSGTAFVDSSWMFHPLRDYGSGHRRFTYHPGRLRLGADDVLSLGMHVWTGIANSELIYPITTGALEYARDALSKGQCHGLSTAIAEVTGWPVFGVYGFWLGESTYEFGHTVVRTPKGTYLDARGEWTEAGLFQRLERMGVRNPSLRYFDERTMNLLLHTASQRLGPTSPKPFDAEDAGLDGRFGLAEPLDCAVALDGWSVAQMNVMRTFTVPLLREHGYDSQADRAQRVYDAAALGVVPSLELSSPAMWMRN